MNRKLWRGHSQVLKILISPKFTMLKKQYQIFRPTMDFGFYE